MGEGGNGSWDRVGKMEGFWFGGDDDSSWDVVVINNRSCRGRIRMEGSWDEVDRVILFPFIEMVISTFF